MRIADVVFDVPVPHPFSYRVPDDWTLGPGQRVRAPLHGGPRVGLVVAVRAGSDAGLKPLAAIVDPTPVLSSAQLDLAGWIATQSLSTLGSTCAALLPPPDDRGSVPPPEMESARADSRPQLFVGHGRERRLLERIGAITGPSLVLVPDIDAAARWATRLGKLGRVVRLDSGAADDERRDVVAGGRPAPRARGRAGGGVARGERGRHARDLAARTDHAGTRTRDA